MNYMIGRYQTFILLPALPKSAVVATKFEHSSKITKYDLDIMWRSISNINPVCPAPLIQKCDCNTTMH